MGRMGINRDLTKSPTKVRVSDHGKDMDLGVTLDSTCTDAGSTTLRKGLAMAQLTASPYKWVPYDDDGSDDGRRTFKGVLADQQDMTENSSDGKTAVDQQASVIQHGALDYSACYGLDANALADPIGLLIVWR